MTKGFCGVKVKGRQRGQKKGPCSEIARPTGLLSGVGVLAISRREGELWGPRRDLKGTIVPYRHIAGRHAN